jgi:hypothetical protein
VNDEGRIAHRMMSLENVFNKYIDVVKTHEKLMKDLYDLAQNHSVRIKKLEDLSADDSRKES